MAHFFTTVALLLLATITGYSGQAIGAPLPFLLGPLLIIGFIATYWPQHLPEGYKFPIWLRICFTAVIGLMIGARITPDLFSNASRLLISLAALSGFVVLAHSYNYLIFRRIGGYDRSTAFFSATPGGLYESISMGEAAGADMSRLLLQQFMRIIVVVTTVPIGLSLWTGEAVGSSSGISMAKGVVPWQMLPELALAGGAGFLLGRMLRLPAWQLIGPMAVAGLLSLTGLVELAVPQWLVNVAQIIIGTALGMRFTGLSRGLILRGVGLGLLSVGGMLAMAAVIALILLPLYEDGFDVLLISFAPGGVTEMALIALSLHANPALVTLHHVFRIILTVFVLIASRRVFSKT